MNLEFPPTDFGKKFQNANFMKTRLVGADFFRGDGRTDMTKLRVAIRNYPNAHKKVNFTLYPAMKIHSGSVIVNLLFLPRRYMGVFG
jgi:hypothetical protein